MNKHRIVAESLKQQVPMLEKPLVEAADQDEWHELDEHNVEWVQAWKRAVRTPKKPNKG